MPLSFKRPLNVFRQRLKLHGCKRFFTVLALESSADDTCAAVLTSNREILSNVVLKQHDIHEQYKGILPTAAIHGHQKNMPTAIQRALREANVTAPELDGIAFTRGPGMGGCLSVGLNAAKCLAAALSKPVVGVHHMQAHALTPFLTLPFTECPTFPFLTLLVSGGHTLLLLAHSSSSFTTLATTCDDSIGNAYDKVSRLLEFPWAMYGPGAALERFCRENPPSTVAENGDPEPEFPLAMRGQLSFSYTGLYTAVHRYIATIPPHEFTIERRAQIAWAFQRAAVGQLEEKLRLGLRWCLRRDIEVRHLVVSGGVASNLFLRERLRRCLDDLDVFQRIVLAFPPVELCTDNAVMIAWAAMDRFIRKDHDPYEIGLRPMWSIEDLNL